MAGTSSISGLVSGLDTSSIISQLMQIEAQPQNLLKTRLSTTQSTAAAYRTVNTRFNALQTAADALTTSGLAAAKTATSSSTSVTASATSAAVAGSSITFTPKQVATTASSMSNATFTSTTDDITSNPPPQWPIQVFDADNHLVGSIPLKAGASLLDAAAAISASGYGVKATIVQVGDGQYRLQVTSTSSGRAGDRYLKDQAEVDAEANGTTAPAAFTQTVVGDDAKINLGGLGLEATSPTNTFSNLIPGVSVTISPTDATGTVTVSVGSDPKSVADKVQALVDAANAALTEIGAQTKITASNASGSTTTTAGLLSGDPAVSDLSGKVLTALSGAVGDDGSPATLGLQTTRDGKITFNRDTFLSAYSADPDKVTRMLAGTPASTSGTTTTPAVSGIAQRLSALAKATTNSTTGTLTVLAQGQDSRAKDLQDQIDRWDTRLAAQQATLTAQFTAMETALSTLKNQSSWLSSQLASLTSSSSSK